MVVFCSTEAAQTRGMFVRGKLTFLFIKARIHALWGRGRGLRKQGTELFAFTLAHPDQSPGIRSLCVSLYRQSPSNKTWSTKG